MRVTHEQSEPTNGYTGRNPIAHRYRCQIFREKMKKLILPISLFILFLLIFPTSIYAQSPLVQSRQDSSQGKKITCEEAKGIIESGQCPFWMADRTTVWCYQEEFTGSTLEDTTAFRQKVMNQPSDFILERDISLCDFSESGQEGDQEGSGQQGSGQEAKPAKQNNLSKGPSLLSIGYKWIESMYFQKLAS